MTTLTFTDEGLMLTISTMVFVLCVAWTGAWTLHANDNTEPNAFDVIFMIGALFSGVLMLSLLFMLAFTTGVST